MAQYTPKTWTTGETITAAELNAIEQAAAAAAVKTDADAAYDAKGAATAAQAAAVQRANHTGTQSADTVIDGTTNKAYTAAEQTKLAGVAAGATAYSDTQAQTANAAALATKAALDAPSSLPSGTAIAHRYDPLRQTYNCNPETLRRWFAALARMKTPSGAPARLSVVGHSYVVGTATSPRHLGSFATKLRDAFNAKYGSAGTGVVHMTTTSISDDPRIVVGGTWTQAVGTRGAFNASCYNATGTGNTIAFTPDIPVDSFTVYYARNINSGTFSMSVDGGTATTVNAHLSGTEDIQAATITAGSLGTHTLTITAPSSQQAYIAAIEGTVGYSGVRVSRVGRSGATVSTITSAGVAGSDSLATIFTPLAAPDLTVICCQINDYLSVVGTATYTANLTTLVNAAKASGDVLVLADPNVMTQPNTNGDLQSAYHAALYGLADSLNFGIIDIAARWKDYPTAVAPVPGLMASVSQDASGVHPYYVGHQDIANAIFAAISGDFGGQIGSPTDVQVFNTAGTFTWTKPAGAKTVEVVCISGGGGGGSGRLGAAATVRCGGGGGASGALSLAMLRGSDVPATVSVTVGAGGTGGAAVSTSDTNGNAGGTGGASSFAGFVRTIAGGNGGAGGTATTGTGGVGSNFVGGLGQSLSGGAASTTGLVGSGGTGPGSQTNAQYAGSGGGAGGGITSADVASGGGVGAIVGFTSNLQGAAGVAGGVSPVSNDSPTPSLPAPGGGGGAGSTSGAAQAGGRGGNPGGGGGGGGASLNGFTSGAGGVGGIGAVVVTTYF